MSKSPDELLRLFREFQNGLSAEYIPCQDLEDAGRKLKAIMVAEDWDKVVLGSGVPDWVRESCGDFAELLIDGNNETSSSDWVRIASKAKVGITHVEALIADTGTLVIPSRVRGDRVASLIPAVHIALVFGSVIYETLSEYLSVADPGLTHQFITGPSRTADIEKTLVVGIHGPMRLLIFGPD